MVNLEDRKEFLKRWREIVEEGKILQQSFLVEEFLENEHHGLFHSAAVWERARELVLEIREPLRIDLINIGCALHDAGRVFPEEKERGNHHQLSFEVCQQYIKEYVPLMEERDREDLLDLVLNHDYFNEEISGDRLGPPQSLEGEIVRAADKMSIDPAIEVRRYWDYAKPRGQSLFKVDTPLEFRLAWTPAQYQDPRTDQLCWFFLIFVLEAKDFAHPVIARKYREWSKKKREAIEEILKIAREECPFQAPLLRENYLETLKITIYAYKKAKGIEEW